MNYIMCVAGCSGVAAAGWPDRGCMYIVGVQTLCPVSRLRWLWYFTSRSTGVVCAPSRYVSRAVEVSDNHFWLGRTSRHANTTRETQRSTPQSKQQYERAQHQTTQTCTTRTRATNTLAAARHRNDKEHPQAHQHMHQHMHQHNRIKQPKARIPITNEQSHCSAPQLKAGLAVFPTSIEQLRGYSKVIGTHEEALQRAFSREILWETQQHVLRAPCRAT